MSQGKGDGEKVEGNSNDNSDRDDNCDRDRDRNGLQRVYSDQRPILNPAELADMEVLLGSKAGTYLRSYLRTYLRHYNFFSFILLIVVMIFHLLTTFC